MKTVKILAVDDHKMTMVGYKAILEYTDFKAYKVTMDMATSYALAIEKIEASVAENTPFDILMLDIQLSDSEEEEELFTGEDIGILARKISPSSKIVFMSSFSDSYRINSVLKNVNPEGYLVKTEINEEVLEEMVDSILTATPYYTKKALIAIRNKMSNDIYIDENDKNLLYYLSIGLKSKDMVAHIALSVSAIQNRKRHLKEVFGVENGNDYALIHQARQKGFI